jgi:hypothetical protein
MVQVSGLGGEGPTVLAVGMHSEWSESRSQSLMRIERSGFARAHDFRTAKIRPSTPNVQFLISFRRTAAHPR